MRDPDAPLFLAGRRLNNVVEGHVAIPNDSPIDQLIWATLLRSKRTFEGISHLLGHEFDPQAAMLARPLFEDMVVAHWIDYNKGDADWLLERFFKHREAMALDQIEMYERHGFETGPLLASNPNELKSKQNELGREFKGRARRDWWDPGTKGRGAGHPIGLEAVAAILEDAAAKHQRFHPRFGGGQEPMLRKMEAILVSWFSRQLHHTAIGLPFQPHPTGPITSPPDALAPWRTFFTAYWIYGQQVYLLLEHFNFDEPGYDALFVDGLVQIGSAILPDSELEAAKATLKPIR